MRAITWICRLGVIALAAALLFGAVIVAIAPRVWGVANSWEGEPLTLPALQPLARPTHVYDADGTMIAAFQRQNSQPIELAKIPEPVRHAFLVVEDREFYSHNGVNARSLVRAMLSNVASDAPQQGASTITMQVAKNEFLGGIDRNFRYKSLQIHYAMMLENQYTKDEIFERYLNTVFFGNNAYGVKAAAETYFGKTVDQLTFVEAAFLAGLVRSPSGYDPIDNPDRSRARFAQVVDLLVDTGEMTEAEGQTTLDTFEIPVRTQSRPTDQPELPRTYYTEALRDYLLNRSNILGDTFQEREAALYRGGLEIHTTLVPSFQQMAEQARDLLPDTQQGFDAAMVSLNTDTGAIVAMVGGRGFVPGENEVNMALAPRQTGSSQKTFILVRRPAGRSGARRRHRRPAAVRASQSGRPDRAVRDHRRRQPRAGLVAGDDGVLDQLRLCPPRPDRRPQPGRPHDVRDGQVAVPVRGPAGDRSRTAPAVPRPGDRGQPDVTARHGLGRPDDRQRGPAHGALLRRVHRRLAGRAGRTRTTIPACRSSTAASPSRRSTCSRAS